MIDDSDEDRPPARPVGQRAQARPPAPPAMQRANAGPPARQPPPRQQPSAPAPVGSPSSRARQNAQARRVGLARLGYNPGRSRDYVIPPSSSEEEDTDAQPAAGARLVGNLPPAPGARFSSSGGRGRGGNNNNAGVITQYSPTPPYYLHTCTEAALDLVYDAMTASEHLYKSLACIKCTTGPPLCHSRPVDTFVCTARRRRRPSLRPSGPCPPRARRCTQGPSP